MTLSSPHNHAQRGAIMLYVLAVLLSASLVFAFALQTSSTATHRTQTQLREAQARQYALGSLSYARMVLERDALNASADGFGDLWFNMRSSRPYTIPNGTVDMVLFDAHSFPNLNQIIGVSKEADQAYSSLVQDYWQLRAPFQKALPIAAIADWIDADDITRDGGAEADLYGRFNPPTLPANAPLKTLGEVRYIQGISPEAAAEVQALFSVLPKPVPFNVNTVSGKVLRVLFPNSDSGVNRVLQFREKKAYLTVSSFLKDLGVNAPPHIPLGVHTAYFGTKITVRYHGVTQTATAIFYRSGTRIRLEQVIWS